MFEYKIPLFNPAPLRREILESMRDLAVEEQNARYNMYSNGILTGCALFENNMHIGVSGGLLKFADRVYLSRDRESVKYHPTEEWSVLKIEFSVEEKTRDFLRYTGRLVLNGNTNINPNELELGRFKLKQGSRLRTEYTDFQDMETEFDTVNLIHVPYADIGEPTLSPVILTHFAREAYPHLQDPLDIAFCTTCLANSGVMSRESIHLYLQRRLGSVIERFENLNLYKHLAEILAEMKGQARYGGPRQAEGIMLL